MNTVTSSLTKILAGAGIVLAALTAALAGSAAPAQAAYAGNPLVDDVRGVALCDRTNRTMSFQASIKLNRSGEQWVGANFSFYEVDGYGRRVGTIYYHNGRTIATYPNGFANPVKMSTWTSSGGVVFNLAKVYSGGSVTWYPPLTGRVHVDVQVAVWNGASWQGSNWIPVRYENSFFNDLYWESYGGGDCLLRV